MSGKVIGYVRVSTFEQNHERQLEGVKCDKVFIDKASGKDTNRPELQNALEFLREDDVFIVHSLDRLARNLDDLRKIVQNLTDRGVTVKFIKESLIFTGEDSSMSKLLLSVMGAFAEFERSLIKERQREGIENAKRKGVYKGRKPKLSQEQIEEIKSQTKLGIPKARIARNFNISRDTLYKYLVA